MQIRRMMPEDIQQVVGIADLSPEAASWTAATYIAIIENPDQGEVWVAEEQGTVAGFASFRLIDAEAELLNLAVHPERRRKGCGSQLMQSVCARAAQLGVERIFLEVRASNVAALQFYCGFGFQQVGRRRSYYSTPPPGPREDALLLAKSLLQAPPAGQEGPENL